MTSEDLSLYSLFPANREQTLESRRRTYIQWGRGLTLEEYLKREDKLDYGEHAKDGKLITWVLAPRDDPTSIEYKCSCETYKRICIVKKGSEPSHEVIGYGIASVYTPPQNRNKGFANRMMSLLHWVLAPHDSLPPFLESWGAPPPQRPGLNNAQFSVLYSDIGAQFYASAGPAPGAQGWVVREPFSTIWDVPKDLLEVQDSSTSVKWLNIEGCAEIIKRDAALMRDSIPLSDKRVAFATLPTSGVALFMSIRTEFFHSGQSYSIPEKWGVEILNDSGSSAPLSFAAWSLDVKPPPSTMITTRVRSTKEAFPLLVSSMLAAARENGMECLEVWNLPKELEELAHSLGAKTEERDEHLNAFKWYGPEKNEDINWAYNEKFAWC